MKSERLFRIIGQIDQDLIEKAENYTLPPKPVYLFRKLTVLAACLVLVVGLVLLVNSQTGLFRMQYNSVNGNNIRKQTSSESSQNIKKPYDELYGKIGANNNYSNSSGNINAFKGGVCNQLIDLSPLGISGYADTSDSTQVGNNLFVLVSGSNNSDLHLAVVTDGKTKLLAYADCGEVLKKLLQAPDSDSVLSHIQIGSIRSFNNYLILNFSYSDSGVCKTLLAVYDIAEPNSPVLSGTFGQSGAYTSYRVDNNVISLITNYTIQKPDKNDVYSYVPYLTYNGDNYLVPNEHINTGEGLADQYSVISQWKISDTLKLMESYAFLGKNISNAYIFGDEVIVPETNETTTIVDKVYGPWQDVPKNLATAETGTKLRYASTISITTHNTELSLYSVSRVTLTYMASVTIPGALMADESCFNQYDGNFRVILNTSNDAGDGGCYENADGVTVELNNSFLKEGFTHIPSPPDLKKYIKSGNALYILNDNLQQIGAISDITSQWINSINFNGETVILSTQYGKITLDLSNPTTPKKR